MYKGPAKRKTQRNATHRNGNALLSLADGYYSMASLPTPICCIVTPLKLTSAAHGHGSSPASQIPLRVKMQLSVSVPSQVVPGLLPGATWPQHQRRWRVLCPGGVACSERYCPGPPLAWDMG